MISVIVPVYGVEAYLATCITSVLAQTESDFELILVDDESPDKCGEICDQYAEKDPRIHVIHQKNTGVSGARNHGMECAKGQCLVFIDSDDWVEPNYLEVLKKNMVPGGMSVCDRVKNDEEVRSETEIMTLNA